MSTAREGVETPPVADVPVEERTAAALLERAEQRLLELETAAARAVGLRRTLEAQVDEAAAREAAWNDEREDLRREIARLHAEAMRRGEEALRLRSELDRLLGSLSWRAGAPLRRLLRSGGLGV